jgi:hypothetical protein
LPVGTSEGGRTFLRTDTRSPLLSSYVELAQPATRKQIAQLGDATACPPDKQARPRGGTRSRPVPVEAPTTSA